MHGKLNTPKLSILIPTKNRYQTLMSILNLMLNKFEDDVEFIIQDNSDNNEQFTVYLDDLNDKRIKYFYTKQPISIVDNTELAINHCTGAFLCFIGDDDIVSPCIMDVIDNVINQPIDAVTYPSSYYWWKNVNFAKEDYYNNPGAFWMPTNKGEEARRYSSEQELDVLINAGALSIGCLPRLYHGLIRLKTLEKIKNKTGKFVLGASPDIALATSLAFVDAKVLYIPSPLTVYGASKNSGGGWTAENKHFGKISEQSHIPDYTKNNWSPLLPDIWSEHTIYPQTVLEVYGKFNVDCNLNYTVFYASMFVNEPQLRGILLPYITKFLLENKKRTLYFFKYLLLKSIGRFKRILFSWAKLKDFNVTTNIELEDINSILVSDYNSQRKQKWFLDD